jgi:CRP/FNR family cyclic AMP-dependent transcriptional regulator
MAGDNWQRRNYKAGAIIAMEFTRAKPEFYLVESGTVHGSLQLRKKQENNLYQKGDTFGLISCLTGQPYIERFTAKTDCRVIVIDKENLVPFLSSSRSIFVKIISDYSNRLREMDMSLLNKTTSGIYIENVDQLLVVADYFAGKEHRYNEWYALTRFCQFSKNSIKKRATEERLAAMNVDYTLSKQMGPKVEVNSGDIIFLEQEKGEEFYFIEAGRVKISHISRDHEYIIAVLGPGEFFGEMGLLNRTARNASAIAFEDSRLTILTRDNFIDKLGEAILKRIFFSLAKRLWFTYRKLLNLLYRNPVTRLYDYLDLLISSNEGRSNEKAHHFDFSLDDLRRMTNTISSSEDDIAEFLTDSNLQFHYGMISIIDTRKFESKIQTVTCSERITGDCHPEI